MVADLPSKAELGVALLRALGTGGAVTLPLVATAEERKAAQAEVEFRSGMRLEREPDPKLDSEHEGRMVAFSVQKLRERADAAESEASDAWTARDTKREHELRAEAERLRATADRHEATLRAQDRARKGTP